MDGIMNFGTPIDHAARKKEVEELALKISNLMTYGTFDDDVEIVITNNSAVISSRQTLFHIL